MTKLKKIVANLLNEKLRLNKKTDMESSSFPNSLAKSANHEKYLDDIYLAVLNEMKGAVIDVGVNTGQTLLKILSIDKNRTYYGFEPQIVAASGVEIFLTENGIENCTILPIALSDRNGCIPIYVRGKGIQSMTSSVSSIIDGFRPNTFYHQKKYIYAAQGDHVVSDLNIDSIALIKIDVEGAELEVIRGLATSIEKYRPFILFEVLHHYLAVTKEVLEKNIIEFREARIKELEEIIRKKGYKIYQIDGYKTLLEIEKIRPKYVNELESTDYVAVPQDREKMFCQLLASSRTIKSNTPVTTG